MDENTQKHIILKYKPTSNRNRTRTNHMLYGRILVRKNRTKQLFYYKPGILHDIKFAKISSDTIYIKTTKENFKEALNELDKFCVYELKETTDTIPDGLTKTGKEHWLERAKMRGIVVRNL